MGTINFIIKILTFPGTFLKGFLEQFACRMFEIPVEFSRYYQKNELCGHVEHMLAPKKGSFGICFLPHIISLICGLAFLVPASLNSVYLGKFNLFGILFTYFGISCLLNCFPLLEDAVNMWDHLFKDEDTKLISKIGLAIPAVIMYAGAYLEHYFITVLTTLGFAYAVPYIFALFIK